jgi:putative oxidoreductase
MTPLLTSAYNLLISVGTALQSPFLLVIRRYWGWQFFLTGKRKLTSLDKVTEFFASLHIPQPGFNAALAGTTEALGGLLLIVGFAFRPVNPS